jgi:chromosome segregation ATPase
MNLLFPIAQTPILNAPNGTEFLVFISCLLVLGGLGLTFLGGIVLYKQAFGRKPSMDDDFKKFDARLQSVESTIATFATKEDVNAKIDAKFTELNSQRRHDVGKLHDDVEHTGRQIATLQSQVETQTTTLANLNSKLDRWLEGELAETRRELATVKRAA